MFWAHFEAWNRPHLQSCFRKQNRLQSASSTPRSSSHISAIIFQQQQVTPQQMPERDFYSDESYASSRAKVTNTECNDSWMLSKKEIHKSLFFSFLFLRITATDQRKLHPNRSPPRAKQQGYQPYYWSKSHNPAVSESLTTRYISAWSLGLKDAIIPVLVL